MIGDKQQTTIKVIGQEGVAIPRVPDSIGLIATQLVMNVHLRSLRAEYNDLRQSIAVRPASPIDGLPSFSR
jgi:hypothetical protein